MKTWWLWLCVVGLVCVVSATVVQGDDRGVVMPKHDLTLEEMKQERRVALVIGNGAYKASPLANPPNDARLMAKTLKETGFELVGRKAHVNVNKERMQELILEFGQQLKRSGGVGLFFFAGHGMQVGGENYLIPVGAMKKIGSEGAVKIYSVSVGEVLLGMEEARNRLNLVVLDACRNNPFKRSFRTGTRGLASVSAPSGTMMLYATKPGDVASDGARGNGPFTRALAKHMKNPGIKLEDVVKKTVLEVESETRQAQTPWSEGVLRGDFYFLVPDKTVVAARPDCPRGMRWNGSKCVAVVDRRCPEGFEFKSGQGCVPVVKVNCPGGTRFVAGQGCVAEVVERRRKEPAKAPPSDDGVKGMVKVPAGKFLRGTRGGGDGVEGPQKEIHLDGFWIDKYEVTVDDYARCVSAGACSEPKSVGSYYNWGKSGRGKHPVNGVNWDQAVGYCKWAGKRLPTEAEWEKAARGTDGRTYSWGEAEPSCEYAVMYDDGDGCGRDSTWEVGSKTKGVSPYGAYDMAGNVWEWTADWYDGKYYSKSPVRNPMGPKSGSYRVLRGGGWLGDASGLRAANRDYYSPSDAYDSALGFRCVRSFN